jgi:hypothetical protein
MWGLEATQRRGRERRPIAKYQARGCQCRYSNQMTPRTDRLTATRIDLALTLLPLVGRKDAARMLAHHQVPLTIALRVLTAPRRRAIWAVNAVLL